MPNKKKYLVCTTEELEKKVTLAWEEMVHDEPIQCFLIHDHGQIYCYRNACPHTGVTLNWMPDQFLDTSGKLIQCATHGALFCIDNGLCIRGPCVGQSLIPVEFEIDAKDIYLIF